MFIILMYKYRLFRRFMKFVVQKKPYRSKAFLNYISKFSRCTKKRHSILVICHFHQGSFAKLVLQQMLELLSFYH